MKQADLIGFPFMLIIGRAMTQNNQVEVQERCSGLTHMIALSELVPFLQQRTESLLET